MANWEALLQWNLLPCACLVPASPQVCARACACVCARAFRPVRASGFHLQLVFLGRLFATERQPEGRSRREKTKREVFRVFWCKILFTAEGESFRRRSTKHLTRKFFYIFLHNYLLEAFSRQFEPPPFFFFFFFFFLSFPAEPCHAVNKETGLIGSFTESFRCAFPFIMCSVVDITTAATLHAPSHKHESPTACPSHSAAWLSVRLSVFPPPHSSVSSFHSVTPLTPPQPTPTPPILCSPQISAAIGRKWEWHTYTHGLPISSFR